MKLKNKFYLLFFVSTVLVLGAVQTVSLYRERKALYERLEQRGLSISRSLSVICVNSFVTNSFSELASYAEKIKQDESIEYVIVTDPYGKTLLHTDYAQREKMLYDPISIRAVRATQPIRQIYEAKNEKIFEISLPIQFASVKWGIIRVGFNLNTLHTELARSIQFSILLILGVIATASLFFLFIGDKITRPIEHLTGMAREVSRGNFSIRAVRTTSDEVGALTETFNQMTESLKKKTRRLREANKRSSLYNRKLKRKVKALSTMNKAARAMRSSLNAKNRMTLILYVSMRLSEARGGCFFSTSSKDNRLSLTVQKGSGINPELFSHLAGKAAEFHRPVFLVNGEEMMRDNFNFSETGDEEKISVVAYPLGIGGSIWGVVVITADNRGFTSDELQMMSRFLDETHTITENSFLIRSMIESRQMDSFNKFASIVAHDLRGAIANLSLSLSNAKNHYHEPEFQKDFLSSISGTLEKMRFLTRKISEHPDTLELKPSSINQILREIVDELDVRKVDNITLKEDYADSIPSVMIDDSSMRKVFRNLIVNALEAMPQGGILEVVSELDTSRDNVGVRITDTGVGMSKEFINNQLFRPFVTTKKKSLGLALYSAREIVRLHGGRMEVTSRPGKGTTFEVKLPLFPEDAGTSAIRKKLGEYLLDMGAINEDQLEEAMNVQSTDRRKIGRILIDMGYIRQNEMRKALERQRKAEKMLIEQLLREQL